MEVFGVMTNTSQQWAMGFTVDQDTITAHPKPTLSNQTFEFFAAHGLSSGEHKLVVTNQNGGDWPALWLDSFSIKLSDDSSATFGESSTLSLSATSQVPSNSTTSFKPTCALGLRLQCTL